MKYQGTLINWDDNRGFGFVEPKSGGQRAFVHIKAFSFYSRRPQTGDLINYATKKDSKGKLQATEVSLVNDRYPANKAKPTPKPKRTSAARSALPFGSQRFPLILTFSVVLGGLIILGQLPIEVLFLYLLASIIAYVSYAADKSAAQRNRWRTPESHLHLIALAGGWPGAYLAQQRLRHKSAKQKFKTAFWITVVLNLAGLGYLLTAAGHTLLARLLG